MPNRAIVPFASPLRGLDPLAGDLDRLFDTVFSRNGRRSSFLGGWSPATDLVETDSSLILKADLPGLSRDDVNITVEENILTVSGERHQEHESSRDGYHHLERSFGKFSRSLRLPQGVSADDVRAEFDNGVLEVTIPKPDVDSVKTVEIKSIDDIKAPDDASGLTTESKAAETPEDPGE